VDYQHITAEKQLRQFCRQLENCRWIAFDTEFVSEHTYRPELCLIQVATEGPPALIDALAVEHLEPFWQTIASGRETIVHAGRSEMEFCLQAIGRRPAGLFDVQLAAGLVGEEYPARYSSLIERLLGRQPHKHETRTDWRRRPLSKRQILYALDDVRYLHTLRDVLYKRLEELGRLDWFAQEISHFQNEVEHAQSRHRWRRVAGIAGLDGRSLAVARELFHWREGEAQRRNKPARRVLRDDLLVELARRQTADVKRIRAVRGLERGDLRRRLDEIAAAVRRGLDLPDEECPHPVRRGRTPKLSVLGQFLFAALGSMCRQSRLAANLVGTPNDIRELIACRTAADAAPPRSAKLAQGWRAEFVGRLFDDLLSGKISIRVADPASDCPLAFEEKGGTTTTWPS